MSLPAGVEGLALATLPRERWRNGCGWTRPVAQRLDGGATRWRVSLAEITEAAPFSSFPGLDRTTVLVDGGPVTLCAAEQRWMLRQPGDRADYPGERALRNERPARPARCWNVMVARGQVVARTDLVDTSVGLDGVGTLLVWVIAGRWRLQPPGAADAAVRCAAEGLVDEAGALAGWTLAPDAAGSRLLRTTLIG